MITITEGLKLPIAGAPEQIITDTKKVKTVGVVGLDHHNLRPTMAVSQGDKVTKGQLLFTDKCNLGVRFTAPAGGVIASINRGEKRRFHSITIDVDAKEDEETFKIFSAKELNALTAKQVEGHLNLTGLWVSFRTRPFSKIPALGSSPHSIFITAIDTHPLAGNPEQIVRLNSQAFIDGITVISKLTEGKVFICRAPGANIPVEKATAVEFLGPHPAGLVGTHIHFKDPVSATKTVWHIGYQDVMAIGKTFSSGILFTDRVLSLAGPQAIRPRLIITRLGANTDELVANELRSGLTRVISGSVFGGRTAKSELAYLGRYHNQISVLKESDERLFMGWVNPCIDRFSIFNLLLSKLSKSRLFNFTTTTNGGERAMLPLGNYEKVMPLDILATQLLRAIVTGDTDMAQKLGALELDEEDLALLTFVCPGKYEYGPLLRNNLTLIEKEG